MLEFFPARASLPAVGVRPAALVEQRVAARRSLCPLFERYRCGAVAGERPLPGEGYRAGGAVVCEVIG